MLPYEKIDPMNTTNLFVYGTLMVSSIFVRMAGQNFPKQSGILMDYARFRVKKAVYPAIIAQPGDHTDGIIHFNVNPLALQRIDAFEGDMYQRSRVFVQTSDNSRIIAHAYILRPEYRDWLTDERWRLETFQKQHQQAFIDSFNGFEKI